MPHDVPLISTIAIGIVVAFIFGMVAQRLRLPIVIGYLVAGIFVGPFTPGYTADAQLASQLAEIGVIFLMFGVGLHFSVNDLLKVVNIAVIGAVVQIFFATLMGVGIAALFGWGIGAGIVFGLALSVASTVVLLRALQEKKYLGTEKGQIAIGWLVVEDLIMVLSLVLIPPLATVLGGQPILVHTSEPVFMVGTDPIISSIIITIAKVIAFVAVMLILGQKLIPALLVRLDESNSPELFRLGVMAIALGVAYAATKFFGVSFALGAFFAGIVLAESDLSSKAAKEILPLRDAFAVLFFVSVGMMLNPMVFITAPFKVLATLMVIMVGKSVIAYGLVRLFRYNHDTASTVAISLAQIGEFSFILITLGIGLKIVPIEAKDYLVAGAIISILFNPALFAIAERLSKKLILTKN